MYTAPPPIMIIAIIPMIIPVAFPLLDFFTLVRSASTCSMNFSSMVGSFDANSSFFLGCGSVAFSPHSVQN